MLRDDVKIVSVDDHIIEPPGLWVERLPDRYKGDGPRVVRQADGTDSWLYGGKLTPVTRLSAVAGVPQENWEERPMSFDEMRPGCYDPVARLDEMDVDGVWAQVLFPHYCRFAGHRFLDSNDRGLAYACVQTYNDFVLDEWVQAAPDRYIPLSIVPLWDVPLACAEVRRVAKKGTRAIAFSENPTVMGLPSIFTGHWDPLFAEVEAANLVLCLHIGSSSKQYKSSDDAPFLTSCAIVGVNSMSAASDWVFSGLFQKFPNLRVSFSEGGAGWVPYLIDRLDYVWENRKFYAGLDLETPTSELLKEHCSFCLIKDDTAIRERDVIGVQNLMIETDYPHADSIFPRTREALKVSLADVPDDEARMIAETNARRVFNFHN